MTVRTKSIHDKTGTHDGLRVLITRYYPRGVRKERFGIWYRELAPSASLLLDYRDERIGWDCFKAMFVAEIVASQNALGVIRLLAERSRTEIITLLCHERDGLPCHRYIIKEMIDNHGAPGQQ